MHKIFSVLKPIVILASLLVFFSCDSPTNSDPAADSNLEDIKILAGKLPATISIDPTIQNTASGQLNYSRGTVSDIPTDEDFDIGELGLDTAFFSWNDIVDTNIGWFKTYIENASSEENDTVISIGNEVAIEEGWSLTINSCKYLFEDEIIDVWIKSTIPMGDDNLIFYTKISLSNNGYTVDYSVDSADSYYYAKIESQFSSGEVSYFVIAGDSNGPSMFESTKKEVNADGLYDLLIEDQVEELDGSSLYSRGDYILNRNSGIYLSDYARGSIAGIAIFDTSKSFIGKSTSDIQDFTYSNNTYNTGNYEGLWPISSTAYSEMKTDHKANLTTLKDNALIKITDGTYFPESEFSNL